MATDFKVPDLGENVESGDIVNVLVKEGDEIQADQSVMEIETGKAVVELPCPIAGRITKMHVHKGSKVKVGDPLLTLEGTAGKPKAAPASKPSESKQPAPQKAEKAPAAEAPAAKPSPLPKQTAAPQSAVQRAAKTNRPRR